MPSSSVQPRAFSTAASTATQADHGQDEFARLDGRTVFRIDGPDAVKFLQGMVTNQMTRIERGGEGILAAFLSAQGRILFDAFVYPENKGGEFPHPSFLVDVDTATAPKFEAHLRRYKLRNRITVTNLASDEFVWQAWGRNAHLLWGSYVDRMSAKNMPPGSVVPKESFCDVGCRDPRHASLGVRFVLDMSQSPKLPTTFKEVDARDFALRRILLGIPEGSSDFFAEQSLPLESNLDYMNGVDFRKGCYLGQELTIRTYHTGVTRKRIVPVQLYNKDDPAPETLTLDKSWTAELPESQTDIKVAGSEDAAKTPERQSARVDQA